MSSSNPPDSLRRRLLALASEALTGAGADSPSEPLTILIIRGRTEVRHTADAGELAILLALADLSDMHVAIVRVLQSGADLPPRAIAVKAGYKFNSRFRAAITELCTRKVLEQTVVGYRLATR